MRWKGSIVCCVWECCDVTASRTSRVSVSSRLVVSLPSFSSSRSSLPFLLPAPPFLFIFSLLPFLPPPSPPSLLLLPFLLPSSPSFLPSYPLPVLAPALTSDDLWRIRDELSVKKSSLTKTYKTNKDANDKVYELSQQASKYVETLALLYAIFERICAEKKEAEQFDKDFD